MDLVPVSPAGTRCTPAVSDRAPLRIDHDLTVVVPAFNEESRLPGTLAGLQSELDQWNVDYRVLVVNDGSRDRTAQISADFGPRFSTISTPRQSGKGAAVRQGMTTATGQVVAFTDADLPYELSSLRDGYRAVAAGECDVCFGARDLAGSEMIAQRTMLRTAATFLFRQVVRTLVSRKVTDTQCGLKVFSRKAAVEIFNRTTIDGFAFDAEVVYLTHKLHLPFMRLPVTLINEYGSTLSLSKHALPMLMDVFGVHWKAMRNRYRLSQQFYYPDRVIEAKVAAADAPLRKVA